MPDIITSKVFVDGERGITATKMNQIISGSVIQPDFYNNKSASSTLDPTDQLLELKASGSYARITGSQLISSVSSQVDATPQIYSTRLRSFNAAGNSNMECDQRLAAGSSGASLGAGTAGVWGVDRWYVAKTAATGTVSAATATEAVVVPGTSFVITRGRLDVICNTTQATLAAGDYCQITQQVEGTSFRELMNDVHSLSVLVKCSRSLTFTVRLTNNTGTLYTLTKLCQITTPNQWTLFTLPNLPMWPAGGTWPYLPGQSSYTIGVGLAAGTTYTGAANDVWGAGNFVAGPGTSNFFSASGTFSVAFVQHEPGAVCTTLMDKPFTQNLDECLRYFQKSYPYGTPLGTNIAGYAKFDSIVAFTSAAFGLYGSVRFPKVMAKQPTGTAYHPSNGTINQCSLYYAASGTVPNANTPQGVTDVTTADSGISALTCATGTSTAPATGLVHWTADTNW